MTLTLQEFARLGGKARMKKMTKAERRKLALLGVKARLAKRKQKNLTTGI